jgi:hypothetical protein
MKQSRRATLGEPRRPAVPVEPERPAELSFVEALIDPVSVFGGPGEVVEHPWFTDEEKRTILLSWARDELAVEQVARSLMPNLTPRSRIDAVVQALARFDPAAAGEYSSAIAFVRGGPRPTPNPERRLHLHAEATRR